MSEMSVEGNKIDDKHLTNGVNIDTSDKYQKDTSEVENNNNIVDGLEKSTNDTKDEKVTNQVPASPKKRRRKPSKKQKAEKEIITTITKNIKFDPERQARR